METQGTELARSQPASLTERRNDDVVTVSPPVDVYENMHEILVVADFPGVPTESLSVRLDGSELLIEGTQAAAGDGMPLRPLHFSRAFRVPNTIDPGGIHAELSNGVLRVHLEKSEAAKPRRIEVKAS